MTEISDKAVEAALNAMDVPTSQWWTSRARAALSAALPHLGAAGVEVPEGWALVPIEPTDEMIEAGAEWIAGKSSWGGQIYGADVWQAMLAERPAALVPSPVPQEETAEPVAWRGPFTAADAALDELRRAVASTMGYDPETWPTHRNAPLAIAALVALLKGEAASPPSHDAELLAALRAALKPFADEAPYYDPPEGDDGCEAYQRRFLVGDLRAARSAVAKIDAALALAASQEGR